jgi:hypothetical protein
MNDNMYHRPAVRALSAQDHTLDIACAEAGRQQTARIGIYYY